MITLVRKLQSKTKGKIFSAVKKLQAIALSCEHYVTVYEEYYHCYFQVFFAMIQFYFAKKSLTSKRSVLWK